ncbi:MAG: amidohydrolase [Myxococcales bacterium]|nr:amidohydrolase [Myxococcales bacterium]
MKKGLLIHHGDLVTLDPAQPVAEAVAIRDGRIAAVGSEADCRRALDGDYETVDLRGAALLPGFIDTHLHPIGTIHYEMNANLRGVRSVAELQDRLRAIAAELPPGQWLLGLDLDEQDMDEPRLPDRHDLDAACPDRPLVVLKHDGHQAIGNSRALAAAGLSAATPDPAGGVIDRESDGSPAGPCREAAVARLMSAAPLPEFVALVAGARKTARRLASRGITSVGAIFQVDEDGPAGAPGAFEMPAMAMLLDHFPINLYGLLLAHDPAPFEQARQSPLHSGVPGGHRIGGIKIIADGSFGSYTSFMREPFADRPDTRGMMVLNDEELYRRMEFAHRAGLQIAVHVIGDAAARRVVDLFDRLLAAQPRADHRHRLEHASVLDAPLLADIARLGLVIATQPLFIHTEKKWLHRRLGAERAKRTYPFRSILDAGIRLAGASDSPVESTDVLQAIACAVTREGFEPQQAVTAAEAVRMYTLDAAYAQFEDNVKGSLAAGKRADLVVLSENPLKVAPERIAAIRVLRTYSAGEVLYEA